MNRPFLSLRVPRCAGVAALLLTFVGPFACAAARGPGKIAVASAQPLATQAGLDVMREGGNAFDAAVAVSAALAVVEPESSGLGGGGFWLLHVADSGRNIMIDGRERAPLGATPTMYQDRRGKLIKGKSLNGPLAAGIPGEPAALVHLARRYGRLSLARDLAPAIRLARDGFTVSGYFVKRLRYRSTLLRKYPSSAAIFLPGGKPLRPGARLRQPDLARTLERIARHGDAGFYRGPVARELVAGVRKAGGIWTLKDLRDYRAVERAPIVGHYHGMKVISASPPSSGGVTLVEMLNILSGYHLWRMSQVERDHLIIEAMRHAYRDRNEYLGDPDFVHMPLKRLLDPDYAAGIRANISMQYALPSKYLPGVVRQRHAHPTHHTTHFSIIDARGNRVAATLSVNYLFGCGFVAPGTGVVLNDEMDDFASKPGRPNVYGLVQGDANAIAPGKRPLSSMTPTFLVTPRRVALLGTPGGSRIISMVLLSSLTFAHGGSAKAMVTHPRFHDQYLPDYVEYEPGAFSPKVMAALRRMGHHFHNVGRHYGNMQVVVWDRRDHRVEAASDPRGIGEARVEPPGKSD